MTLSKTPFNSTGQGAADCKPLESLEPQHRADQGGVKGPKASWDTAGLPATRACGQQPDPGDRRAPGGLSIPTTPTCHPLNQNAEGRAQRKHSGR